MEIVFCDVFEQVAFMFGEPADKESFRDEKREFVQARMSFSGDSTGQIAVTVPVDICPEIAANILGVMDDDDAMNLAQDALKEMLNISCGQLLTTIAGEEKIFDLSVPEIVELKASDWKTILDNPDAIGFSMDDYPVLLEFQLND